MIISFLFTLFFELTQLSALFGIYPRPYRVFDVDDLILNTAGSMFGYFIVKFVMHILPSREKIDDVAIERGQKISAFRRIFAKCIDLAFVCFMCFVVTFIAGFTLTVLHKLNLLDKVIDRYHYINDFTFFAFAKMPCLSHNQILLFFLHKNYLYH